MHFLGDFIQVPSKLLILLVVLYYCYVSFSTLFITLCKLIDRLNANKFSKYEALQLIPLRNDKEYFIPIMQK